MWIGDGDLQDQPSSPAQFAPASSQMGAPSSLRVIHARPISEVMTCMSFQEYVEASSKRPFTRKPSKPVIAGALCIALACIIAIICTFTSAGASSFSVEKADTASSASTDAEGEPDGADGESEAAVIFVHVAGCVNAPGICELPPGARLAEAIEAAGGFTEEAASESVNLARVLEDGEQIIVSSQVEAEAAAVGGAEAFAQASQAASSDGRININAATDAELQTISGIGPAKAQKIIAYREANGPFKTVDDLCNVSGIGEKTLESIRDQISVS